MTDTYEPGDYVKVEFPDPTTGIGEWMLVRVLGEEDVFRSSLNAPPFRRRRPPLQTPSSPTIPDLLHAPPVYSYSASVVWFYSALDN